MSDTVGKSSKRLLRYLVAGSFFMFAGAAVYASQTETLEFCKAVYDPEMLKLEN